MQKPGSGSVTPRKDGRWWARGPRPERTSLGTFDTFEEADEVRRAAVLELAATDRTHAPGVSLRAYGARVLAERERELPRSAQAERSRWKRIMATAPFADDPLDTISAPTVDAWVRTLKPGSARCTLTLLSQVCGRAVREGLLASNPCAEITVRTPPRTHEPWTYLLLEEQRALLAAPIDELDRLMIACLLGTGVRIGELFALRLADVHAHASEPHIVIRYGSPHGPTKGKKIRTVPLFGLGLRAFRRWLEVLPSWCAKNPLALAFPGRRGGFQSPGSFLVAQLGSDGARVYEDRFRAALAAAGIVPKRRHDGRPVRAHDLRHTFAASLVSGWWGDEPWRLEDLRAVMGHSSIKITERYAHLAPGRVQALAARSPGVQLGYDPPSQVAIQAAKRAPTALLPAAQPGTRCSPQSSMVSRGCEPHTPAVPRSEAIAGLRALARGDEEAARGHALRLLCGGEPTAARLADVFEAALEGQGRKGAVR